MDNAITNEHPIVTNARNAKEQAIKLRDDGRFLEAVQLLKEMIERIDRILDEFKGASRETAMPSEIGVADQGVHLSGTLGGIFRRWGKLDEAVEAYAKGAEIERNPRYGLPQSYTSTQHAVLRCLREPDLLRKATGDNGSAIHLELGDLYRRITRQMRGPRKGDVYAAADRAVISLILGQVEWEKDLTSFLDLAKSREEDYAKRVTAEVIRALAMKALESPQSGSGAVAHWKEALALVP